MLLGRDLKPCAQEKEPDFAKNSNCKAAPNPSTLPTRPPRTVARRGCSGGVSGLCKSEPNNHTWLRARFRQWSTDGNCWVGCINCTNTIHHMLCMPLYIDTNTSKVCTHRLLSLLFVKSKGILY